MLHHKFIPTGLPRTGVAAGSWGVKPRGCLCEADGGQRLTSSSQPSHSSDKGAAGTCSHPPASYLQDPQGSHILLPRSHLLGERRRSNLEQKAAESRGKGRKQWERQFSLIWANPLPAEWSQNLTRKKNNSFPASRHLGAGFPQPMPQRHREIRAMRRVLWGHKAPVGQRQSPGEKRCLLHG